MKTMILAIVVSILSLISISAQKSDTMRKTRYAVELSQFITGSGFASSTEIYFTVLPDNKKSLSFGMFYCPDQKKISGIAMHHEYLLTRNNAEKKFVTYAFYNMVYRFTRTTAPVPGKEDELSLGLYKSLEHHLGIGLKIRITPVLNLKAAAGYGIYIGSIKKPTTDPLTGETIGSNGFGAIAKIGISYTF